MVPGANPAEPGYRRPRLLDLLRVPAFRVLFAAELQSIAGDQLARVALSVLVFERTHSAAATALTYATTFLPAIVGGIALAGLGDRYSRRTVLIGCDLVRVAAFGAMAIPALPLPAVVTLLVAAVLVGPAHTAAQVSYLADALDPEQFRTATGIRLTASQLAQVFGFAFGGGLVAAIGARDAVSIDAVTFLVAAAIIAWGLPVPAPGRDASPGIEMQRPRRGLEVTAPRRRAGLMGGVADRLGMRTAIGLCWLQGFFVVPEGLAVPFGAASGASTTEIGLLFAALPFGGAIGALLIMRTVPPARRRPVGRAMAVLTGVPLVFAGCGLPLSAVLLTWAASGALAAYQLEVISEITQGFDAGGRAASIGRVGAGLITAQGLGVALFGTLAQGIGARAAVAWAGATGVVLAVVLVAVEAAVRRGRAGDIAVAPTCDPVRRRPLLGPRRR